MLISCSDKPVISEIREIFKFLPTIKSQKEWLANKSLRGLSSIEMRFLKNAKGQVAIFVVLIFQVLFILFAMSINVAMLAYDKINLQNSLDLAAYYGAKKQSEVLSAMAHINYQMRQNWKLLSWRYRILGTLAQHRGDTGFDYWCPQNKNAYSESPVTYRPDRLQCQNTQNSYCSGTSGYFDSNVYPGYCDPYYFVCISHNLWKRGVKRDEENFCTTLNYKIEPVTPLRIIGGFMVEAHLAARAITDLQSELKQSCPQEGALNWLMTQFFMTHFRLDQKDRKSMIKELYIKTLYQGRDLDGESIFEGAKKVFCKNLSSANKKSLKDLCNPSSSSSSVLDSFDSFKGENFESIFKKVNVWPVLQFLDTYLKAPGDCEAKIRKHSINGGVQEAINELSQTPAHPLVQYLRDPEVQRRFQRNEEQRFFREDRDPLRDLTLSFVKDPKQILYYGLSLEFDYESKHQVFSLRTPIKFKASSFAKPFGSSFGPQPKQIDPLIPVHYPGAPSVIPSNLSRIHPYWFQPNYSRFPGDKWGLIDKRLHDNSQTMNFLNKHFKYDERVKRVYTMEDYFHLTLTGGPHDPLARNNDSFTFTRLMELMAVYPDLYDISYYSILGNYHQTYFPKVCKLLTGSLCDPAGDNSFSSSGRTAYVRGDFGWPDTDTYIKKIEKKKKRTGDFYCPLFFISRPRQQKNQRGTEYSKSPR